MHAQSDMMVDEVIILAFRCNAVKVLPASSNISEHFVVGQDNCAMQSRRLVVFIFSSAHYNA